MSCFGLFAISRVVFVEQKELLLDARLRKALTLSHENKLLKWLHITIDM